MLLLILKINLKNKIMSKKEKKYPYEYALKIAKELVQLLKPHCERIEIAGSIRRKKAEVGDIELVVISKPYLVGLFENGLASIVNKWVKVKGDLDYIKCKYTQRILPSGIKLDLFFANKDNWGYVYAVRTGSADFSHQILAKSWVRAGFKGKEGMLVRNGKEYPAREEEDFFRMIGVAYVPPEERNM